jgi:hypothetical protein
MKPEDIAQTLAAIEKKMGPIDCLVYDAVNGIVKTWDKVPIADI